MKKHILLFALLVSAFTLSLQAQQGKWAGTIKYQLTWSGDIPAEAQLPDTWEIKVFENKTKSASFMWAMSGLPATELTDAARKTVTFMFDFSMIPMEELNGKWFIRNKLSDEDFAGITYKETGNTKEIAGKNVKEFICTSKDQEGVEVSETIWACEEMGPSLDLMLYPGLKAMPFEYKIDLGESISCSFKVIELIEGKVKNTEMLLETGYEELTMEEFQEKLQEAMGGGAGAEEGAEEDF